LKQPLSCGIGSGSLKPCVEGHQHLAVYGVVANHCNGAAEAAPGDIRQPVNPPGRPLPIVARPPVRDRPSHCATTLVGRARRPRALRPALWPGPRQRPLRRWQRLPTRSHPRRPGYIDVAPSEYADFTHRWVQAAVAQCAAEQAGLLWVTSIAARRTLPLATLRRPGCAHWTITAWPTVGVRRMRQGRSWRRLGWSVGWSTG